MRELIVQGRRRLAGVARKISPWAESVSGSSAPCFALAKKIALAEIRQRDAFET